MDALLRQIPRHGPVDLLSHSPTLGPLFLMQGQALITSIAQSPRASDLTFERIKDLFSDREIVEIIQIVGAYWSFGRLCTTLDIEVQDATDLSSVEALARLNP